MKLLVNIDGLRAPLTGIGHYTRSLLLELLRAEELEDVCGIGAKGWLSRAELERLLETCQQDPQSGEFVGGGLVAWFAAASVGAKRSVINAARRLPYTRRGFQWWRGRVARAQQSRFHDYIYWEPGYSLLPLNNPSLVTLYDLSHVRFPEYHPRDRVELLNAALPDSIKRAQAIVTISEFTCTELKQCYGLDRSRLTLVSPAVGAEFCPRQPAELLAVKRRYALPARFLMSLGTQEPRKNLLGLLEAFASLPDELRNACPLVLVGGEGWGDDTAINKAMAKLAPRQLLSLGYVPQHDLPLVLAAASALAYPSFYEGFGLPVLEAMSCGVPVLTSQRSAMSEVASGAALLVDPFDQISIAKGLQLLLTDDELRKQCRARGLEVAAGYAWQKSAQQLLQVLQQVAQQGDLLMPAGSRSQS